MVCFERSIRIDAPRATVFKYAFDPVARAQWDSFIAAGHACALPSGALPGFEVRARSGWRMTVQTLSHVEGRVSAIRKLQCPVFLSDLCGSWHFHRLDDNASWLRFPYHFHGHPRWMAPLIEAVFSVVFARICAQRLLALKAF